MSYYYFLISSAVHLKWLWTLNLFEARLGYHVRCNLLSIFLYPVRSNFCELNMNIFAFRTTLAIPILLAQCLFLLMNGRPISRKLTFPIDLPSEIDLRRAINVEKVKFEPMVIALVALVWIQVKLSLKLYKKFF